MIQTHGFGVQVMPENHPPDGSLLANHQELIADGILKAFQVADEYTKMKAFKAQQDEIAALRNDRMAAAKAKYGMDVGQAGEFTATSPGRVGATNAGNQKTITLAPLQTQEQVGALGNMIGENAFTQKVQPDVFSNRLADINLATERAPQLRVNAHNADAAAGIKSEGDIAAGDLENKTRTTNAGIASDTADFKAEMLPEEQTMTREEIQDKLLNAKDDRDAARLGVVLRNKHMQSEIGKNEAETGRLTAQGKLYDSRAANPNSGRAGSDKTVTDLGNLQRQEMAYMNETLKSGDTVKDYIEKRRAGGDGLDWMGRPKQVAIQPDGEEIIAHLQELDKLRKDVIESSRRNRTAPASSAPEAPPVAITYKPATSGQSTNNIYDTPATDESGSNVTLPPGWSITQ